MATLYTADAHLGHANIIRYTGRPFADVARMDAALVANWNAVVGPEDTVWVLGDVVLGRLEDSLALVSQLHGHKLLVAGNHDRCWAGHGAKAQRWVARYLEAGFEEVHQASSITIGGQRVSLSHFPYHGDSKDHDRHTAWRPVDDGSWLLHGHVHERWRQRGRMINVGVDVWDFHPVSEDVLADLIAAGPADLGPLPRAGLAPESALARPERSREIA